MGSRWFVHSMPGCTYECLEHQRHTGLVGCCHTCTYFLQGGCRAPQDWGYYPRALVRMLREA